MKTMNKVITAMMMLAITTTMPAMAGSKKHNNGKKDKVVVLVDKKKGSRIAAHKHAYCPVVKACTFKVNRFNSYKRIVARAEHMKGVMNTKWDPRSRELTIIYDAKVTSARHIMHAVA